MSHCPTPHISAMPGDFAKTVLMPGDPLRSRWIAQTMLTEPRLVNDVRGVQGYTGFHNGKEISVMASGMGMPSIAIYAYELYNYYGVENIIRIGTAGAVSPHVRMRDLVASMSCCSESSFGFQYGFSGNLAPTASFALLEKAAKAAQSLDVTLHIGPTYCSDVLYHENARNEVALAKLGILAAEMEAAALYLTAMRAGRQALTLCTVVENPHTGECASAEDRECALTDMLRLAFAIAES